jgi:diguanylate cyclase (GGDEF)-like protein/PAS domain S-box-containing protein
MPRVMAPAREAPAKSPPSVRGEPLLARVVGLLLLLGGVLGAVALALPHPAVSDDVGLAVMDAVAFAAGFAYLAFARRIPLWFVHVTVAASSLLICSGIYFSGVATGLYSTMFVWVALFTAYFFSRRAAILHLLWLLACYAGVLALVEDTAGFSLITRWLLTAIALAVTTGLTSWLVARREAAERRSEHFFELSRDMLCTADRGGYLVEVNPAWERTLGYKPDELRSRPFIEFVHPDDRDRTQAEVDAVAGGQPTFEFENRWQARDGSWRWLHWTSTLSEDEDLLYARATDVTERRRIDDERQELMSELDSAARTDPLTGVPNRRWLASELDREMARARRDGPDFCLALLDLDHFKRFNDRHGHLAGDRLLREACRRWRSALRTSDFLARYGGEEFVVLLPNCSPAQAVEAIERLRSETPAGQTCSAGIATWDGVEDAVALIARADAALYEAKEGGRDRIVTDRRTRRGHVREGASS